jgi:hypothetical protein
MSVIENLNRRSPPAQRAGARSTLERIFDLFLAACGAARADGAHR